MEMVTRSDNDEWDVTESVGATALGAAEARAREADNEHPLFTDPYAQVFLDAAAARGWSSQAARVQESDPQMYRRMQAIWCYSASRTKWFDEFFTGAGQAVILAAGLDARAWRLPWVADSVVFEIDLPRVLQFKAEALPTPSVRYIPVLADLREDWPQALLDAGFDRTRATSWSAEGLLPYLSSRAQDTLFERIDRLSAPGSRVGVDAITNEFYDDPAIVARMRTQFGQIHDAITKVGGDMADPSDLRVDEARADPRYGCASMVGRPMSLE
jgi:methyltransferase (TIGR00027 family)